MAKKVTTKKPAAKKAATKKAPAEKKPAAKKERVKKSKEDKPTVSTLGVGTKILNPFSGRHIAISHPFTGKKNNK